MSTFENIAEELKKLRQLQGGGQEDLARNLGVSFATGIKRNRLFCYNLYLKICNIRQFSDTNKF